MADPDLIYKVSTGDVFAASEAAGTFLGMPVDAADGYLHFSTAAQLGETLRRYFAGQSGLALFSVAVSPLGEALKWEVSRGGDLFPHLYAPLSMSAVRDKAVIAVATDGSVTLPDWVR